MVLSVPTPFSWGDLVDHWVAERGSLTEVVRLLYERHPHAHVLPADPGTVERGIRRLRGRTGAPGEKYGLLLLRSLGLPLSVATWAQALGTYHGPLQDLPLAFRREQLRLWDRPPISESAQAAWIHLAQASLAHQDGQPADTDHRLSLAAAGIGRAGPAAALELRLFQARRAQDGGDAAQAQALLGACAPLLEVVADPDRACFHARWLDQRAYVCSQGWRAQPARLAEAEALYREIPTASPLHFVVYRHHQGLAWVRWRQGAREQAAEHARQAITAAGDGGLCRLRAASLRLLAHILPSEAPALRARAAQIVARLDGAL